MNVIKGALVMIVAGLVVAAVIVIASTIAAYVK